MDNISRPSGISMLPVNVNNETAIYWTQKKGTVIVPLTCGHYSCPVSEASSWFDFPHDPADCPTCGEMVTMTHALQRLLNEEAK